MSSPRRARSVARTFAPRFSDAGASAAALVTVTAEELVATVGTRSGRSAFAKDSSALEIACMIFTPHCCPAAFADRKTPGAAVRPNGSNHQSIVSILVAMAPPLLLRRPDLFGSSAREGSRGGLPAATQPFGLRS